MLLLEVHVGRVATIINKLIKLGLSMPARVYARVCARNERHTLGPTLYKRIVIYLMGCNRDGRPLTEKPEARHLPSPTPIQHIDSTI